MSVPGFTSGVDFGLHAPFTPQVTFAPTAGHSSAKLLLSSLASFFSGGALEFLRRQLDPAAPAALACPEVGLPVESPESVFEQVAVQSEWISGVPNLFVFGGCLATLLVVIWWLAFWAICCRRSDLAGPVRLPGYRGEHGFIMEARADGDRQVSRRPRLVA